MVQPWHPQPNGRDYGETRGWIRIIEDSWNRVSTFKDINLEQWDCKQEVDRA